MANGGGTRDAILGSIRRPVFVTTQWISVRGVATKLPDIAGEHQTSYSLSMDDSADKDLPPLDPGPEQSSCPPVDEYWTCLIASETLTGEINLECGIDRNHIVASAII